MKHDTTPAIVRINPSELATPPGYSQIVEVTAGRIIFIAGQTALDSDGNVVGKNDFAAQAAQVFRNLTVALEASRCTAANLVKLRVFLTDMNNLASYREARVGAPRRRGRRLYQAVRLEASGLRRTPR